ncbi:alpha/beta-hydrolase [Daedaleopsis nitida]|nr:alpha/beta-hydrolase [Daedaleopsis nitida]
MLGKVVHAFLPLLAAVSVSARMPFPAELRSVQAAAGAQFHASLPQMGPLSGSSSGPNIKNITFKNPRASEFWIGGTTIPDVDWDIGDSWAGLLPITNKTGEDRKLFFWFFPPGPDGTLDDILFWTNGGPGCSSLEGLLQENGPISWPWGTARPVQNEHSWTNLSSVLYLEQPIGTGYSQGEPSAVDEHDIAEQIVGFLQQFLDVFQELKHKKLYLSGESYAGMYIPYLADYIYNHPTKLEWDLQGFWIGDPLVGWWTVQQQIPAMDFVNKYDATFSLPRKAMKELSDTAEKCGYTGYLDEWVTYPPKGLLPLPGDRTQVDENSECDVWTKIRDNARLVNPGFNIYRIFDNWPFLWDVLGLPTDQDTPLQSPIYFDRKDVKQAIHAPIDTEWAMCSNINVFPHGGDASLPPAFTVLPDVIAKNKRTVIVHGLADYVLIAEGMRIALQNMTWHDEEHEAQGFQNAPVPDNFVVDGVPMGTVQSERKLTYYEVVLSGHMVPQFSPKAAFQTMQYLMGFREDP